MSFTTFFENPKNYWIRWVLLIPVSIITYILISPLMKIILEFPLSFIPFGEFYRRYVVAFIAGFSAGNAFIGIVALMAPKGKKLTAFIFVVLSVFSIGAVMFTGYTNSQYHPLTENVAVIIGTLASYLNLDKDGNLVEN